MKKVAKFNLKTTEGLDLTVLTEKGVKEIIDKNQRITTEEKVIVNALYKGVFGNNPTWKSCSPCNKQIIDNLKKVYEKSCKV